MDIKSYQYRIISEFTLHFSALLRALQNGFIDFVFPINQYNFANKTFRNIL